ncbi:MAG: peptidoglycan recognition family protein [Planctomycetota bacterium]|nr:peptidoglycan recognition family protein [Planctomycetota bacterium]
MNSDPTSDLVRRREALVRGAVASAGFASLAALLSGCGSGTKTASAEPGINWPNRDLHYPKPPSPKAQPKTPPKAGPALPTNIISRSEWASGAPIPSRMDPAQPYYRITIHHDGMDAFTSTDRGAASARLEQIRRAHLDRGFGDIGYHYLIDPAGRVWQGRTLEWQGAHVKATNQGNLGVCMLGNYMEQQPTDTQLAALDRFVNSQMRTYRVNVGRVYTHRELGPTECPGNFLQPRINALRTSGQIARA